MFTGPRPAYENEHPWSPGFQVVRPCMTGIFGGSGSDILRFSNYNIISLANPTTVYNDEVTIAGHPCQLYSDIFGDFDGDANCAKLIAKLADPLDIPTSGYVLLNLVNPTVGDLSVSAIYQFTYRVNSIGVSFGVELRVRPILDDFDHTLVTWDTWNDSPPVSLGTATGSALNAGGIMIGAGNAHTDHDSYSYQVSSGGTKNIPPVFIGANDTIYGFFIDIRPIGGAESPVTIFSGPEAIGVVAPKGTTLSSSFLVRLQND